jgi:putative inorganic carbon (hco3(-)) transporter
MSIDRKLSLFYGFSILFTILNIFFIVKGFFWLSALPLALGIMLLYFFSLDKLIFIIVLLTPFSFTFEHEQLGFAVNLPTEPLIVAVMLLFVFRLLFEQKYDMRIVRHPITIILLLNLAWMLITSVTSEIPLVSFKYFISRFWFVATFFLFGVFLFREKTNMHRFFWLYGVPLAIVVIYATIIHAQYGFERKMGYASVSPFFNDHTHYGAVLAMIAPFFIVMGFHKSYKLPVKLAALAIFGLFVMGILLSYSRASWVSLIVALAGFSILALKIKFRMILALLILFVGSLFVFQTEIMMKLQRNTQESSGDFSEHARSVSNITSDASNLERINRWRSAFRMYEERPVLGWGPGTYQLVYAPFQLAEDKTIITTNFGDLGNAHSEYIGPLAESGMPGMLLFIALAVTVLVTGIRLFKSAPTREFRLISLGITLGFITYFVHGLLNNFLDTDEASVLFWGMMAILVGIDVFHQPGKLLTPKAPDNGNIEHPIGTQNHPQVQK